jgi:ABC-type bacteriocin transporter
MYKKYYVPQVDERDCGVAALSMVTRYYGSEHSLAQLRELAKTDLEGTTALGIVRAAEHLGFETRAISADMSLFEMADLPLPFIVHVNKNGNLPHYYVVRKVTKRAIEIADPDLSAGVTKISYEKLAEEWTGVALFLGPKPNYQPSKNSKDKFFSFMPVIFRQKKIIANIIVASFLVTIISIAGSFYLQGILDTYIPDGMKNTLGIVSIGLIVAYIIQQLLSYAHDYLLIILGQRLSIDVILSYIKHIYELPMSFFGTRRTGEITSRFTDANSIIDALASTALSLFLDLGIVIIVGVTLAVYNFQLFLITLVVLPVYAIVIWLFVKPFEKLNRDTMQAGAMLSSSIIENINGIETIKALTGETISYQKVDREYVKFLKKSFSNQRLQTIQEALKGLIELVLNVAVLWLGSLLVMSNKITIGELVAYNALLGYFTQPLQSILNLQGKLQAASVANNRLNEVYLVPSEFEDKETKRRTKLPDTYDIEVANLSFRYGFGVNTLDNINVKFNTGEKIALVGVSGSGKSTLVKMLVNFFQPEKGQGVVKVGNVDINQLEKHDLRRLITYLPQDPYTFTGKIIDNLLLGAKAGTTFDDVLRATEIAGIRADIETMNFGFETEISENTGLSGGQRQRISLARALLTDSPVLILDESTSNLDVLTEKRVIDNLLALENKTIIFVAHRLTIAERVERVLVMQNGQIVEDGTHESLLSRQGAYADLINR